MILDLETMDVGAIKKIKSYYLLFDYTLNRSPLWLHFIFFYRNILPSYDPRFGQCFTFNFSQSIAEVDEKNDKGLILSS